MNSKIDNLKNEKFTFSALIGIMLISLVYISMYTLSMKENIDSFKQDMQAIHREMNLLLEFIPEKDSVIAYQKNKIVLQMERIQLELNKNELSQQQRTELINRLNELKQEVYTLKKQAEQPAQAQIAIVNQPAAVISVKQNDTLLELKDKEIAKLKGIIESLKNQPTDVNNPHKLSVYYLTAVSQDKKNRASRTNYLNIQLQLKGDISQVRNKYLHIEVRDPSHRVISSESDKIRIVNQYITAYRFEPFRYKFIKGKYSIRIYTPDSDFQSVTFLTLI